MRNAVLAAGLAALATAAPAVPAAAVPPLTVSGTGNVSPGFYPTPTPVWPNAVGFRGTAADPAGTTYGCEITGTGTNFTPGEITGFADVDCGPSVAVGCPFTMNATTWTLACAGGGTLAVSWSEPTFFWTFSATGVLT